MQAIYSPEPLPVNFDEQESVFLAGSIAMGQVENWQEEAIRLLAPWQGYILNPRRQNWDASWVQSTANPEFVAQVNWELSSLERSKAVLMYFHPETQAPISLLELGLIARKSRVWVCCPANFWRRGNVEIVCQRHQIPMTEHFDELMRVYQDYLTQAAERFS